MSAPKKANTVASNNTNDAQNFDWVKDQRGQQKRIGMSAFLADRTLVGIYSKPAKGDAPARAYLSVKETDAQTGEEVINEIWASREASAQIAKHFDPKTGKYTKGTLSNLLIGEYYVQDQETKERILDEDGMEVTNFRIVKPEGNFTEGVNVSDLL